MTKKLHTDPFSANSDILYLKYPFNVFNVTLHLTLELRKYSNFHNLFIRVLGKCPAPWIITSTHYGELGTPRDSAETYRKVLPGKKIK